MTPPPRTRIRVGQIWQRKAGGRKVQVTRHDPRWGVVRLEPLAHGRPSHSMELTLRRNYVLVTEDDQ